MMQPNQKTYQKTKTDEGGKNAQVIHDIPFQIFSPKLLPPYTNPLGISNDLINNPNKKTRPLIAFLAQPQSIPINPLSSNSNLVASQMPPNDPLPHPYGIPQAPLLYAYTPFKLLPINKKKPLSALLALLLLAVTLLTNHTAWLILMFMKTLLLLLTLNCSVTLAQDWNEYIGVTQNSRGVVKVVGNRLYDDTGVTTYVGGRYYGEGGVTIKSGNSYYGPNTYTTRVGSSTYFSSTSR